MVAHVVRVDRVEKHPKADRLTINHLSNGARCISNLNEAGEPRYRAGDLVAHVALDSIVPEWLLKRQGCWNEEEGKGILGEDAGNRVVVFVLRKEESLGMLVAGEQVVIGTAAGGGAMGVVGGPQGLKLTNDVTTEVFPFGADVSQFLGITEWQAVAA